MADKEIRELEQRVQKGDKNAYPLLAVAYERNDELSKSINTLKYYFNYLQQEQNIEEQLIALNNYFRVLLDYCNKQNECNISLRQLAWFILKMQQYVDKPYQLDRFFNIRAYSKQIFTSVIIAFHSEYFAQNYPESITVGINNVQQEPLNKTLTGHYGYSPKFAMTNWPEINHYLDLMEGRAEPNSDRQPDIQELQIALRDCTELWASKDGFDRITLFRTVLIKWAKTLNISQEEMKNYILTTSSKVEGSWL